MKQQRQVLMSRTRPLLVRQVEARESAEQKGHQQSADDPCRQKTGQVPVGLGNDQRRREHHALDGQKDAQPDAHSPTGFPLFGQLLMDAL